MLAQFSRLVGGVLDPQLAPVVPAPGEHARVGDLLVVVGVGVGQENQKPVVALLPLHEPVHGPQRQAVPVPTSGHIVEDGVVLPRLLVVPENADHGAAAHRAEGGHPHRDLTPGEGGGDQIGLGGQLLLLLVLGGGGVQQDVHRQVPQLALLPLDKHPAVLEGARPPGQAGLEIPRPGAAVGDVRLEQDGVLQLLGQLGEDVLVLHQARLVVRPVLLPLALEHVPLPGGLLAHIPRGQHALGKVEAAVLVVSGAQGLLRRRRLRGGEHGHPEAVLHILPQNLLPGLALPQTEKKVLLPEALPALLLHRPAAGLPQAAQGIAAHQAASLFALVEDVPAGEGGPLPVGDAPPGPVEPLVEEGLHPAGELLLGAVHGEGQVIQHPLLPGILLGGVPQGPPEPQPAQVVDALTLGGLPGLGRRLEGVLPPQVLQHRPVRLRPPEHHPLQAQPEQVGVEGPAGLALEGVEQGPEPLVVIEAVHQADDGVEVQVRLAVRTVHLKVGPELVVLRPVPELVFRPAALNVFPVHISPRTAWSGPRPGGCGPTPRRPPAAARRGRRPC